MVTPVQPEEELICALIEGDVVAAKLARELNAYLLTKDTDNYVIPGLKLV